ncbi:MAG: alpha-E domain-containing protein [Alphaproteobacteria bacterium]|nr:alpha-E domain-containing protein [Alphaproteobacteria bacterium]
MLSSTAKNLYWLARYIERAENTARILEATNRIALLTRGRPQGGAEWLSVTGIYGCEMALRERHANPGLEELMHFMAFDEHNPSSIYCGVRAARNNARAERNNLTTDVWENLNGMWLELQSMARQGGPGGDWHGFLDWVKKQAQLVTGAAQSTLLRDEAFNFLALGNFIERGDSTARILDVKYHILLPKGEPVGGSIDYYHWSEILSCVSAFRIYRRVYASAIEPWRVAELMILRRDLPRSLHFCQRQVNFHLEELAEAFAARHEAHRLSGEIYSQLRYGRIELIFQNGLHEFLTDFIQRNGRLSDQIERDFLMK